jgi:hypothetical protein
MASMLPYLLDFFGTSIPGKHTDGVGVLNVIPQRCGRIHRLTTPVTVVANEVYKSRIHYAVYEALVSANVVAVRGMLILVSSICMMFFATSGPNLARKSLRTSSLVGFHCSCRSLLADLDDPADAVPVCNPASPSRLPFPQLI